MASPWSGPFTRLDEPPSAPSCYKCDAPQVDVDPEGDACAACGAWIPPTVMTEDLAEARAAMLEDLAAWGWAV